MCRKKRALTVRINRDLQSINEVNVKGSLVNQVLYELRSIPFYLMTSVLTVVLVG
jgi:hypothetical protein